MKLKLVDTHCHLDNTQYDEDRELILNDIQENMEFIVNIGYDLSSSRRSIEFAEKYSNIYATIGLHPTDIGDEWNPIVSNALLEMGKNEKVVAIGEIGLDYHWMTKSESVQKQWFREQLEIARTLNKPVVIHTREATEDTVKILKEFPDLKGIVHCYPGSYETAMEIIKNYYFGIGGVLTFKNSKKMVEVVKKIPLDRMVIETDSPYLTPEPHRGKRNLPQYVEYVVKKIAEIKEISVEEVIRVTNQNARDIYNIK